MGPHSAPMASQWVLVGALCEGSSVVSLQGAALKYLPSILEDVFGILDSSALG